MSDRGDHEDEDEIKSPEKASKSALSGFLPRKDRQHGKGALNNLGGQHVSSTHEERDGRPGLHENTLGGLPAPRYSRAARIWVPSKPYGGKALTGTGPKTGHHEQDENVSRTAQPEQGSLAALLQESTASTLAPSVKKQALGSARSPKANAVDERTRRANDFYQQYQRPQGRPYNASSSPATVKPIGIRNESEHSPRFNYPGGWSPNQQQAPRRGDGSLKIVDTFEDRKTEVSIGADDADRRPLKRQRLTGSGLSDGPSPRGALQWFSRTHRHQHRLPEERVACIQWQERLAMAHSSTRRSWNLREHYSKLQRSNTAHLQRYTAQKVRLRSLRISPRLSASLRCTKKMRKRALKSRQTVLSSSERQTLKLRQPIHPRRGCFTCRAEGSPESQVAGRAAVLSRSHLRLAASTVLIEGPQTQ